MTDDKQSGVLHRLESTLASRRAAGADKSYVASLHAKGLDAILKKVGEEAAETLIAGKGGDRDALIHELADLWFHCLVLAGHQGIKLDDILNELIRREGTSGHAEKASRNTGLNAGDRT